jgi:diguanylate cyclase (GGDEF)-like protein
MIDDDRSGVPQRAGNHGMQRPDNRPWPEGRRLLLGFGLANGLMVVGVTLATGALLPLLPFLLLSIGAIGLPVVETMVVRLAASTTARRARGLAEGRDLQLRTSDGKVLPPVVPLYRQPSAVRRHRVLDPLTELPGRDALAVTLGRLIEEARSGDERVALIAFDLDRMKDINGMHGYAVGDQLLRIAARRLEGIARDGVFRLDGDRFVVVRRGLGGIADAELAAVAALDRIGRPIRLGKAIKQEMRPSASVGIALYPDHGADFEALMRCAEMAVDDAKRAGGRRCRVFDRGMITAMQFRKDIERDLADALEAGDLSLHYQPQLDLTSGRIVGVEALMRWNHPARGLIPPTTFIPIAEASGLIKPMGTWLVHEACRTVKSWQALGLDVAMAINISAAQLRQQNLPEIMDQALTENGIDPSRLELELTESLFVDPSELMMRRSLDRLAEMGIRLAIDDFGTGYSSLAYLKRLPVQKIKIDKSFTQGIGREEVDEALVKVIIHLARTFGKKVLAEGVETEAQHRFLIEEDCDAAQGYLFAKPMPYAACTRHLQLDATAQGDLLDARLHAS